MEDRATPQVSVVVPVLNGEETIGDCLASLLSVDYPEERREIIIVDNGSTDRTAEIVKKHPVRYVREERRGCSAARNTGIRASEGEIVAFTDADCMVGRAWTRQVAKAFEQRGVGGVAGEVFAYPAETPAERYAARVRHLSPQKYLSRPLLPFAAFPNLAFRRDVFDRVGLLDESVTLGESTDFCTRFLRGTGLKLEYAPRAVVFHRHRKTAWEFFKQQWTHGRGHAQLYLKYREEIPWGWRQSALAYRDVARTGGALARSAVRHRLRGGDVDDLHFAYFEFLKKLAERLGFIRESLAQGRLHL
jgi:glycosyltransferase involved in cell wall biosynthesis